MASAVSVVRPSGEWTSSSGGPGGDRQDRRHPRGGQALGDEGRLPAADRGQRRVGAALEAAFGDERGLAMPDEDQGRVEAVGDRRWVTGARLVAAVVSRVVSARLRAGSSTGR